jgi:hypothetical protein
MATALEEYTIEAQRSFVRFLWDKGLNGKVIHKYVSCLRWEMLVA